MSHLSIGFTVWIFFYVLTFSQNALADCATTAGIAKPTYLPNIDFCHAGNYQGCNGWEPIGGDMETVIPPTPGRLFQWIYGKTTCFLFVRNRKLNGGLCFDTTNCNVCAYNGYGQYFTQLEEGPQVTDNCANCHTAGPILPLTGIWLAARELTKKINETCTNAGGPRWINAPTGWLQQDISRRVAAPNSCKSCHTNFVRGGNSCGIYYSALHYANGSMKKYFFDLNSAEEKAECQEFNKQMGCGFQCQ